MNSDFNLDFITYYNLEIDKVHAPSHIVYEEKINSDGTINEGQQAFEFPFKLIRDWSKSIGGGGVGQSIWKCG